MPYIIRRNCFGEVQSQFEIFRNIFILPDLDPTLNNSDDYPAMLQLISEPSTVSYYEINTEQDADPAYSFDAYLEGSPVDFTASSPIQLRDENVSNDTSIKLNATPLRFFSLSSAFKDTWKYDQVSKKFQAVRNYRLSVVSIFGNGTPAYTQSSKLTLKMILENRPPQYNMKVTDLDGAFLNSAVNFQQVGQGFIIIIDSVEDAENGINYFARFLGRRDNPDDNPFYMKPAGNGFPAIDMSLFFRVSTATVQKTRTAPNLQLAGFDVSVDIYGTGDSIVLDPSDDVGAISRIEIKYVINDLAIANDTVNNKSIIIGLYDQLVLYDSDPYGINQLSTDKVVFNAVTINGNTPDIIIVEDEDGLIVNGVRYVMSNIVNGLLGNEAQRYNDDRDDYLVIPFIMQLPNTDDLYFGALQIDSELDSANGLFGNDVQVFVEGLSEMNDSFPLLEEGVNNITIPGFDSLSQAYRITTTDPINCCLRIKKRLYWNGSFGIQLFVFAGALGLNGINSYKMVPGDTIIRVNSVRSNPIINELYR